MLWSRAIKMRPLSVNHLALSFSLLIITLAFQNVYCLDKKTEEDLTNTVFGTNETASNISHNLVGSGHNLYSGQLRAMIICREELLQSNASEHNQVTCDYEFDGLSCWPATPANTEVKLPCPSFVSGSHAFNYTHRKCLANGLWSNDLQGGNYSNCKFNHFPHLLHIVDSIERNQMFVNPAIGQALDDCVDLVLSKDFLANHTNTSGYCEATFDGWSCWNRTAPGTTVFVQCPEFIPAFLPSRNGFKVCLEDGTWYKHPQTSKIWSNYTTCIDKEDLAFRQIINKIYTGGYLVSACALSISLFIFFSFKTLKCTRIAIHKNLFISFIANNLAWLIWYETVINHPEVNIANPWWCRALHVLVHYFLLSNYAWTFCEGLYLHTLLVVAFVSEERILKYFFVIGWGVPLIFISFYTGYRATSPLENDTQFCWIEESPYSWWYYVPVILSFVLNITFLINIVRVLITKLRAVNSPDTHQTRKAVKATLILLPLLGLHFLVTPFRPEPGSHAEAAYEVIAALVASLQGLCVAIIFCFCNGEVISAIRTSLSRQMLQRRKPQLQFRNRSFQTSIVVYLMKKRYNDWKISGDLNRFLRLSSNKRSLSRESHLRRESRRLNSVDVVGLDRQVMKPLRKVSDF